jgi:hypothetical protein
MNDVDLLATRVERERVGIDVLLPVEPDSVVIAVDDPFHIGRLRLAVIDRADELPGPLPIFRIIRRIPTGNGPASCDQANRQQYPSESRELARNLHIIQNVQPTIDLRNIPLLARVNPIPTPKFSSSCGRRSKFRAGTMKCCCSCTFASG